MFDGKLLKNLCRYFILLNVKQVHANTNISYQSDMQDQHCFLSTLNIDNVYQHPLFSCLWIPFDKRLRCYRLLKKHALFSIRI